jgi:hypothetical protein
MRHFILLGFTCLLLLISLTVVTMATEFPGYVLYIQGGESSITNGTDGMTVITVKEVVPYFHITDGNKSILLPVEGLTNITNPLNTAVVFSDADSDYISLVEVSDLSLSEGNTSLILQVKPLEFYDGKMLRGFANEKNELPIGKTSNFKSFGIYMETTQLPPANADSYKITFINNSNIEKKPSVYEETPD